MPSEAYSDVLLTIVAAVSLGTILTAIARKTSISSITLLLLGGVVLGPEGVNLIKPDSLQDGLRALVSFSIGLILFEGGLTLDIRGYRSAPRVITRLLSVGLLTTWFVTAACIRLLFDFSIPFCMMGASLVTVTGPTVMVPLLKRIRLQPLLHNILHWESVLIDPIGVFLAVLCFEYVGGHGGESVVTSFALRVVSGLGLGMAGGLSLWFLIHKKMIDEDLIEIVPLAVAALVFGISESLVSESGLLATTVAGLALGASGLAELKQVRRFKGALTDLLIGMLFLLLAARLNVAQFANFGIRGAALVALVMFLVRPVNILVSTLGESLTWRQQTFLSWLAPRGIVAASMSSLVALSLEAKGVEHARFIETFTYAVIVATVLIQGLTAGWLAQRLGLHRSASVGWLIVGGHVLGRRIGRFIQEAASVPVVMLDSNPKAIQETIAAGLTTVQGDARDMATLVELPAMQQVGNMLAITNNEDLNTVLCQRWSEPLGRNHVFGWHSSVKSDQAKREWIGSVVWPGLPKPSMLSSDLERGMAALRVVAAPPDGTPLPDGSLLAARSNIVMLDPRNPKAPRPEPGAQLLVFERRGSYLVHAARADLFVECHATRFDDLLNSLLERLIAVVPRLPAKELRQELVERENVMSSAIGHGVAIPHAYNKAVNSRLCAVARLPNGLAMKSLDDDPVRIVFLILGPPGDPEGHLALIAEIARLVADPNVRSQLIEAGTFDEWLSVVRTTQLTPV